MVDIEYCYSVLKSNEHCKVERDICLRITELYEELDNLNRMEDVPDNEIDDKLLTNRGWILNYLSVPLISNMELWYNLNYDNVNYVDEMFKDVLSKYWMWESDPQEYNTLLNDLSMTIGDLLQPFVILKNIIKSDAFFNHEQRIDEMIHRVSQSEFNDNQMTSLLRIITSITEDEINEWINHMNNNDNKSLDDIDIDDSITSY